MVDLKWLQSQVLEACKAKGWDRSWSKGGCYLHLEASEFIESLRGKGDDSPTTEAADVMFVLLSMMAAHKIDAEEVTNVVTRKCVEAIVNA